MSVQNFTAATTQAPNPGSSGSGSSGSDSNSPKSKSHSGAIAGGVVGGVAVLAIIAGAAIFFVRRGKNRNENTSGSGGAAPQEMPGQTHAKYEMPDNSNVGSELANNKYAKVDDGFLARPRHEMPTNDARHELA